MGSTDSSILDRKKISVVLSGINIPPQPQVLVDIQMEMAMPDFCLDHIAQIISKDVGLSGWILKAVNSSFFGLPNKITSIKQAINLLGLNSIINIVNAVSIADILSSDNVASLGRFWDNAADVASACALIANKLHLESPEEAYALGLFHDCAIPLLRLKHEQYFWILQQAYQQDKERITEIENQQLQTNHAVIGYYVAKSWKLPKYLCEAIADHHKVEDIFRQTTHSDSQKKNLLAVLKIAEHFVGTYKNIGDQTIDHEFEKIKQILLSYLGITDIDLDDLRDDLLDQGIIHI